MSRIHKVGMKILTLLLVTLFLSTCSSVFIESYQQKYSLSLHNSPLSDSHRNTRIIANSNTTAYSIHKDGALYTCEIPLKATSPLIVPTVSNSSQLEIEKLEAIKAIESFTLSHKDAFIVKEIRYWSYIYRFNNDLHQVHIEKTSKPVKSQPFGLPVPLDLRVAAAHRLCSMSTNPFTKPSDFELIKLEDGTKYVTQMVYNGSICDLTGIPRTTTIHYLCNMDAKKPTLKAVEEWRTCEYIAELESDFFCQWDMWKPQTEALSNELNCYPEEELPKFNDWDRLKELGLLDEDDEPLEFFDVAPIQMSDLVMDPLNLGIFWARYRNDHSKRVLILTNNYQAEDLENYDVKKIEILLGHIAIGFQNLIKHGKFMTTNVDNLIKPVGINDQFKYIIPMYGTDRKFLTNVGISQDHEGFLISYFSDEEIGESNFLEYKEFLHKD